MRSDQLTERVIVLDLTQVEFNVLCCRRFFSKEVKLLGSHDNSYRLHKYLDQKSSSKLERRDRESDRCANEVRADFMRQETHSFGNLLCIYLPPARDSALMSLHKQAISRRSFPPFRYVRKAMATTRHIGEPRIDACAHPLSSKLRFRTSNTCVYVSLVRGRQIRSCSMHP